MRLSGRLAKESILAFFTIAAGKRGALAPIVLPTGFDGKEIFGR